jgi:hypothetical protein
MTWAPPAWRGSEWIAMPQAAVAPLAWARALAPVAPSAWEQPLAPAAPPASAPLPVPVPVAVPVAPAELSRSPDSPGRECGG